MLDMKNDTKQNDFDSVFKVLEKKGSSFAIATVIRTMSSTAAKPGMKAIISASGKIVSGWLGGGCITTAVCKTAVETLKQKKPKLVVLRPSDLLDDNNIKNDDQIFHKKNYCPSEGSMDIFVEPFYPKPELIIYGNTPIADELVKFGKKYNFNVVIINDEEKNNKNFKSNSEKFVVLATQGEGDLKAINSSLEYSSNYIGLVASKKKFNVLKKKMIEKGCSETNLKRLICPAGIDINAVMPEEVALSIFAEIIQLKRAGKLTNRKF
jgi:xanthine dehydrogenase accessory factor